MTDRRPSALVRDALPGDMPFPRRMLVEASTPPLVRPRPTPAAALRDPIVALYLVGWGRAGDTAVIAVDADGRRIGAAWYRLFTADAQGYGHVDTETPELAIAVSRHRRGRGVGTALLLTALLGRAEAQGVGAVSLSVSLANPVAMNLYRRAGFEVTSEETGHATMVWRPRR